MKLDLIVANSDEIDALSDELERLMVRVLEVQLRIAELSGADTVESWREFLNSYKEQAG